MVKEGTYYSNRSGYCLVVRRIFPASLDTAVFLGNLELSWQYLTLPPASGSQILESMRPLQFSSTSKTYGHSQ